MRLPTDFLVLSVMGLRGSEKVKEREPTPF